MPSQIRSVHARRRASTRAKVLRALSVLEANGRRVTVSSVAEIAGVTRATIYNHPELAELIGRRRREQDDAMRRLGSKLRAEARERSRLIAENRRLREQVRRQGTPTRP